MGLFTPPAKRLTLLIALAAPMALAGCFSFYTPADDPAAGDGSQIRDLDMACQDTTGKSGDPLTRCGLECVDPATDWRNCGQCDHQCQVGAVCQGGECVTTCPPGLTPCQDRCVHTETDESHCGTCHWECGEQEQCRQGRCVVPLAHLALNGELITMEPDQQISLEVTVTPAHATNRRVTWESQDPAIAIVDQEGTVTSLLPGETLVKVTSDQTPSLSAQTRVVVKVFLTGLTTEPPTLNLTPGERVLVDRMVYPHNASEQAITWKSSDPQTARVDPAGNVTGNSVGTAIITATAGGVEGDPLLKAETQVVVGRYHFQEHTFTTCGAQGRLGPSREDCLLQYDSTNLGAPPAPGASTPKSLQPWWEDGTIFTVEEGIQKWTVPVGGIYRIEAGGARGGQTATCPEGHNGGATVAGHFQLRANEIISILAGQEGTTATLTQSASGGGGGTFVVNGRGEPLVVAGGGGGHGHQDNCGDEGAMGQESHMGPGGGRNLAFPFGNGAGWSGDGKSNDLLDARSFINGGTGGVTTCYEVEGGFGGGGSPWCQNGGGGGGYSGGTGGYQWTSGGGGGSCNRGTEQTNNPGTNNGPGYVTVTWMAPQP